jgi:serine/threonine protein kinase
MAEEVSIGGQSADSADASTLTAAPGLLHNQFTARPGDRFGPYKVLEEIGQGGCGAVFIAEQEQPVRRRVALKVIKLGMDTRQVIARFEAERQALAMMDHPNIARVLARVSTDSGRPFFVESHRQVGTKI